MANLTIDATALGKFSNLNADRFLKAVAETVIEEMRFSMRNTGDGLRPALHVPVGKGACRAVFASGACRAAYVIAATCCTNLRNLDTRQLWTRAF